MNAEFLKLDLIKDEGLKLKPYKCTAGKLTIGIGRNIEDVGISKEEALALLDNDIKRVTEQLFHEDPWMITRPEPVQRAVCNMTFQMGLAGVMKFKSMLACIQAGDYQGARRHALDSAWAKQTPERAERVTDMLVQS
jgi:lysozyme